MTGMNDQPSPLAPIVEAAATYLGLDPAQVLEQTETWRTQPQTIVSLQQVDPEFAFDQHPACPDDPDTKRALHRLGYACFLAQPHPFFVYGTLRPGQPGAHHLVTKKTVLIKPGRADSLSLHHLPGFLYPHAAESAGHQVIGDVIWVHPDERRDLVERTDAYEEFYPDDPIGSEYERVLIPVTFPNPVHPAVLAWTYLARGKTRAQLTEANRVTDGNWLSELYPRA